MPSDQIFFASIPPYKSRSKLSPPTVDRCLTHWATALHTLRHLPDPLFTQQITPTSSFTKFLLSYISNDDLSHNDTDDWVYPSTSTSSTKSSTQQGKKDEEETIITKVKYINRSLRLCLKRAISLGINISEIFGSNYSYYIKLGALFFVEGGSKPLLRSIWNHDNSVLVTATKEHLKSISTMLQDLASGKINVEDQHIAVLQELCYFVMTIPEISFGILSEETVFEDLAAAYFSLSSQLQQQKQKKKDAVIPILEEIRRLQFTVIMASTQADPKRYSTIIDFLFNFIAGADTDVPMNSYITAIISQTPLLDRLTSIDAEGYTNRWSTILAKLQNFDSSSSTSQVSKRITKLPRRKQKSKHPSSSSVDTTTIDIPQKIHELSQLFPHTSKSILQATLSSTNYDLETATMLLLDNPSLESSSSPLSPPPPYGEYTPNKQSTNPPDELSTLTVPTSRLYLGKRDISGTADNLLKDRSTAPTKSQILSALQAFDSDDDERDDTYDHEDVGAVDPTTATESEANNANNNTVTSGGTEEKALYNALVQNPGVFTRDAVTRRGNERKLLREVTGMSDEAIEGWKIMNVAGQQRDNAPVVNQDGKEPYIGKKTTKARGEHNRKMQSAARDRQRSKKMSKGMGGGM
ncbi:hypothetical protein TWF173_001625 [Orbilia oligospora]|nr:hypothetical protein TWF173_001625 [Orbilia oligospora]